MSLDNNSILPDYDSNSTFQPITYLRLFNNSFCIYNQAVAKSAPSEVNEMSKENLKSNRVKGKLSSASKRRIRKYVEPWLMSIVVNNKYRVSKFERKERYIVMLTLTLSAKQVHSDKEIRRKILIPFIDKLKYNTGTTHYFYRSEKQENGNIHFHLVTDRWIDKEKAAKWWNDSQERLGYISEFFKNHGHRNPPSTKLTGQGDVNDIVGYVMKYATKTEKYNPVEGRLYGMADTLLEVAPFDTVLTPSLGERIKELAMKKKARLYSDEFFTWGSLGIEDVRLVMTGYEKEEMNDYFMNVFDRLYNQNLTVRHLDISGKESKAERITNEIGSIVIEGDIPTAMEVVQLKLFVIKPRSKSVNHFD